jgi:peroxiredoxin Q/BCP
MPHLPRSARSPSRLARVALVPAVLAAALLFAPSTAHAQSDPKSPATAPTRPANTGGSVEPRSSIGLLGRIAPGVEAPDFELDGSGGVPVRLASLRGGWVMLAFAATRESLAVLSSAYTALTEHGVRLVGVCHDKASSVVQFARRSHTPVLVLADVTGEVSAMYGLWDAVHGATLPGYVLIDPRGVVRAAYHGRTPAGDLEELAVASMSE